MIAAAIKEEALMLAKLLKKTNPSGVRATWTKLRSYLKKPSSPATKEQAAPKAASHKPYLMAVHNKVKQEIARHLVGSTIPDFIKIFLHAQWSRLMLKIYLKRGPQSEAWKHSVQLIDDLIMVTNAGKITSVSDHEKNMESLLYRLNRGMDLIPVPPTARNRFLDQLQAHVRTHVKKLNQLEKLRRQTQTDTVETPAAPAAGNDPGALFAQELLVDNKKDLNRGFNL